MANSVDPDQKLQSAASDLGLHCLQRPICSSTKGYYIPVKKNKYHSFVLHSLSGY